MICLGKGRRRDLPLGLIIFLALNSRACSSSSSSSSPSRLSCLHGRPWGPSSLLLGRVAPAFDGKPVAPTCFGFSVGLLSLRGGQAHSGFDYEDEEEEDIVYNNDENEGEEVKEEEEEAEEEADGDDDSAAANQGSQEADYGCVADDYGLPGRGYHGDGLEWVSGKRAKKKADVSYQVQPDEDERGPVEATLLDGGSQKGAARVTGGSLIRRMDRGLTTENMRPPVLRPLDLSVYSQGGKLEGPEETEIQKFRREKGSCVPRGEVLSAEKELIELWRQGNEELLPHFASMEVSKKFPGSRDPTQPSPEQTHSQRRLPGSLDESNKGRNPILTAMPTPDKMSNLLPKSGYIIRPLVPTKLWGFGGIVEVEVEDSPSLRDSNPSSGSSAPQQGTVGRATPMTARNFWRGDRRLEDAEAAQFREEEEGPRETDSERQERRSQTTVVVLGTGRMGKALARVWARGGYRVIIGSRDFTRGKLAAGEVSKECGARVEGGEQAWAVQRGDIIVLATPFCETGEILAGLRAHLVGKGKIFIDVTNAEYDSQSIEHTAGVEINRAVLGDRHAPWAVAYKSVFSRSLSLGGGGSAGRKCVEIAGDSEARIAACDLVRCHGWQPKIKGHIADAKDLEPGRRVAYLQQMYGTS